MRTTTKCYSELIALPTLEERYEYLRLTSVVGEPTFGSERYINQTFYRSARWKEMRRQIIIRDGGCDLGVEGYEILSHGIIHHMNPMTVVDITSGHSNILDPEYLILTAHRTHNAIHFGDERLLPQDPVIRRPGDTKLW